MQIVNLTARNVKRLSAVHITPVNGEMVVIGGNNAAGKSSVLDSIMYALAGKKAICDKPVREGQAEAEIVLDLGEYIVTRTMRPNGKGQVKVTSKDGAPFASPQAMLDKLMSKLAFDPLDFLRMEARKQVEQLKQVLGLDFAQLDGRRAALYDERTAVSRSLKALKAQAEVIPPKPENCPAAELSVADLSNTYANAVELHNKEVRLRGNILAGRNSIEQLKAQMFTLQERIDKEEAALKEMGELPSLVEVKERLDSAEEHNRIFRQEKARAEIEKEIVGSASQEETFSDAISLIDTEKKTALANAKYPVLGLSFGENGLTFNGQPFEQSSSAEQLKVAVAMAAALDSELKVILIRDGSLLDNENLTALGNIAEAYSMQVWVERVGAGKEVTVLIDDGTVIDVPVDHS